MKLRVEDIKAWHDSARYVEKVNGMGGPREAHLRAAGFEDRDHFNRFVASLPNWAEHDDIRGRPRERVIDLDELRAGVALLVHIGGYVEGLRAKDEVKKSLKVMAAELQGMADKD